MDLLKFRREFNPMAPSAAARFTGPIANDDLGFGLLVRRLDDSLVNFDNQNNRILLYDETGSQDQIADVDTNIPVVIQHGALLREDPILQKVLQFVHVLMFTNTAATFKFLAEFDRIISEITLEPNTYNLPWTDLTWDDIEWVFDTWYQEAPMEFGEVACKWGSGRIEKTDASVNFAYFGLILWLWPFSQIRTFR